MRSSVKYVIFILIFAQALSVKVFASFSLDKDYCFLSTSFDFEDGGENVMGLFQMAFSSPPVILPIMNLSFSGNFKPENISISWKSARLNNRNGQPLFDQDFMRALNASEKDFPFYRNGGEVYYSPAYGFLNSQVFISMFLSQVNMEMNYSDNNGSEKQVLISLSGSDQSFRELAVSCYKEKSTEFLNEHSTRRKNLPESWAKGYGLLVYPLGSLLQEGNYLLREEFKTDIPKSYDFYSGLYPLLERKGELLLRVQEIEKESTVSENLNSMKGLTADLQSKQTRLNLLDSISPEGLIQQTRSELLRIEAKRLELDQTIQELKDSQIKQTETALEEISASNSVLVEQLNQIDAQISDVQEKLADANKQIEELYTVYAYIGGKVDIAELERIQALSYSGPPLTFEEIQRSLQAVSDLELEILSLTQVLDGIKALEADLRKSLEQYQLALSSYNAFLEIQREITQKRIEIERKQVEKQKQENDLQISVSDLQTTNRAIEQSLSAERSLEDEKASIIAELRNSNTKFDAEVEKLDEEGHLVLYQIICRSNIFRADVNDYCMTASDLNSDSEIYYFFEKMDAVQTDNIIINSQMDYSYPWRHPEGKTKPVVISEKLSSELKSENFIKINQIWNEILTYRWRYNQVRNETVTTISAKNYNDYVDAYRSGQNILSQEIQQLATERDRLESNLVRMQTKYLADETEYHKYADAFAVNLRTTIESYGISMSLTPCQLNFFDVLGCEKDFTDYVQAQTQELSIKEHQYKADVENLALVIVSGINVASDTKSVKTEELGNAQTSRVNFLRETQLESLLLQQDKLNQDFQKLQADLRLLESEKEQAEVSKAEKVLESERFADEKARLLTEVDGIKSQISVIATELETFCSQQGNIYSEIEEINSSILSMGGVISDSGIFVSPCQSIKSMVLR